MARITGEGRYVCYLPPQEIHAKCAADHLPGRTKPLDHAKPWATFEFRCHFRRLGVCNGAGPNDVWRNSPAGARATW
jgi:hypothetical protein